MINDNPVDLGVHYSQTKTHHVHNTRGSPRFAFSYLPFLNQAWLILTHRVLVSLGFLGLTFDCLTLISLGINGSETSQRDMHTSYIL